MTERVPLLVHATWDEEAKVWVATSDDVPGLATEAESLDVLVPKLKAMIPELLELNGRGTADDIPFKLIGEINEIAHPQAA